MGAVVTRRSLISFCVFLSGLLLACGANAQIRNDRLYNDIVNGGIDELLLGFASGIPANQEIFQSNSDRTVSLLALSVYSRNDDAAMELLAAGARIDSLDGQFGSASTIEVLAQQGMARTLRAYLDQNVGALVGVGSGPLLATIQSGELAVMQLLLDRMSAVVQDYEMRGALDEALIYAARRNDTAAIEILLERGADPGSGLPLVAAVANCSPDTAGQLLGRTTGPLASYEGEHLAFYALRCFELEVREDADSKFSRLVELLHEADSSICPVLTRENRDEALRVSTVLADLDLCQ